MQVCS